MTNICFRCQKKHKINKMKKIPLTVFGDGFPKGEHFYLCQKCIKILEKNQNKKNSLFITKNKGGQ